MSFAKSPPASLPHPEGGAVKWMHPAIARNAICTSPLMGEFAAPRRGKPLLWSNLSKKATEAVPEGQRRGWSSMRDATAGAPRC